MRYDASRFDGAVCALLQVSPALRRTSAYRYDLVDVTRQAISNRARALLPQIKSAYLAKDAVRLRQLTGIWMGDMAALDRLLASEPHFLLGRWLSHAAAAAGSAAERAQLLYDQRSILAGWGDRSGADGGGLHDYANREWAGLIGGLYAQRWQRYFTMLTQTLDGQPSAPIDWFALEQDWARSTAMPSARPQGDSWRLAHELSRRLGICGSAP
jgi:alpha-N-acetylglucosaminidase